MPANKNQPKDSSRGIVVEHKNTGIHYAVSTANFNPKVHRKVRELTAHESVLTYQPKHKAPGKTVKKSAPSIVGGGTENRPAPARRITK